MVVSIRADASELLEASECGVQEGQKGVSIRADASELLEGLSSTGIARSTSRFNSR